MAKILLIAVGGGVGSVMRYWVAGLGQALFGATFPFGTLLVNTIGALLLGALAAVFAGPMLIPEQYRLALTIGLLGGFTTFSTYALETFSLTNEREWGWAAANVLLNNGLALAAAWLGYRLAERVYGV
jgi:CrcB protein